MRLRPGRLSPEMLAALAEERQAVSFASRFDPVHRFANLKFVFDDGVSRVISLPDAVAREFTDHGGEVMAALNRRHGPTVLAKYRPGPRHGGDGPPAIDDEVINPAENNRRCIASSFEMHVAGDAVLLAFEVEFNIYSAFTMPLTVGARLFHELRLRLVEHEDRVTALAH